MLRPAAVVVIAGVVLCAAIGLAGLAGRGSSEPPVVEVPARWNTSSAQSIDALRSAPLTFVGDVQGLREQQAAGAAGSDAPLPVSLFDVRVVGSWSGGLAPGETVIIQQAGGEVTRRDGKTAMVLLEGDQRLVAGNRYLFIVPQGAEVGGRIITQPFNRLEVTDDGLAPLRQWAHLDALASLSGRSAGEAQRTLGGRSR
jgi:hypothetical protein